MNIITRNTLLAYCQRYKYAEDALLTWYAIARKSDWKNFNEVKARFPSADQIGDDRMVINIKGNHYRLVVRFSFQFKAIQIKWFGTHAEYDKIDATSVQPNI